MASINREDDDDVFYSLTYTPDLRVNAKMHSFNFAQRPEDSSFRSCINEGRQVPEP
jgi:hypothetical protein